MSCEEKEPTELIAGFSAEWTRKLTDYPTDTYTLKYVLRKLDGTPGTTEVTATDDGPTTHKAKLTPAATENLLGTYQIVGFAIDTATGGTDTKDLVYDSTIEVKPDPATAEVDDRRSHARRMVDILRNTIEKLAAGTLSNASVNGKTYTQRDISELRSELARYESVLASEEARDRIREGCGNPNNILIRFNRT